VKRDGFRLALRIPGWAKGKATMAVNGQPAMVTQPTAMRSSTGAGRRAMSSR
jgi:DUF1680 family protein